MERLKNPTPIGDTGIVMEWVRTQVSGAGRMNNVEIEQALKSGSFGTKFSNAYDRATKGTLDPTFRRQMVSDIGLSARSARMEANKYRRQATPDDFMPGSSKSSAPPKSVVDAMRDGQWVHGPDGASYQKKGGKLVDRDGNPVEVQ
jgi:hypothetical protein